jgi:hypothetical protein
MLKKLFNLLFPKKKEDLQTENSYHESILQRIEEREKLTKKLKEDNEKLSRELDEQIEMLDSLVPKMDAKPKRKYGKKKSND